MFNKENVSNSMDYWIIPILTILNQRLYQNEDNRNSINDFKIKLME